MNLLSCLHYLLSLSIIQVHLGTFSVISASTNERTYHIAAHPSAYDESISRLDSLEEPSPPITATEFPFVVNDVYVRIDSLQEQLSLELPNDQEWLIDNDLLISSSSPSVPSFTKAQDKLLSLQIQVNHGTLVEMDPYPGLWIRPNHNSHRDVPISIIGLFEDLKAFVDDGNIAYLPPRKDWKGIESIQLDLSLWDLHMDKNTMTTASSTSSSSSPKTSIHLRVEPFIEFSVEVYPNKISIDEDEALSFQDHNITYAIEGCAAVTNTGTVIHMEDHQGGNKNVDDIRCILYTENGNVTKSKFQGRVANVVKEMSSVVYYPQPDFYGMGEIRIHCENLHQSHLEQQSESQEQQNRFATAFISVDIYPVNDEPQIILSREFFSISEDEGIKLGVAIGLYIVDADVVHTPPSQDSIVAVHLDITMGQFHLPDVSQLGGIRTIQRRQDEVDDTDGSTASYVRLVGRLDRINIALQNIWITFPKNWYGSGTIHIRCTDSILFDETISDLTFGHWTKASANFLVHGVNDSPVITVYRDEFVGLEEGGTVQLGIDKIDIHDDDAKKEEMFSLRLSLTTVGRIWPGNFELGESHRWADDLIITDLAVGAVYSRDNPPTVKVSTPIIEMKGTLGSLSTSLKKLVLVLANKWYGVIHEGLTIELTDEAGASDYKAISMIVVPSNDRIAEFVLSNTRVTSMEDEEFVLSDILNLTVRLSQREYSLEDRNAAFKIRVQSIFGGTLHFTSFVEGCHVLGGLHHHERQNELILFGTTEVLEAALNSLVYTPPMNVDSFDEVIFELYDAKKQNLNDEVTVRIDLEAVNDEPEIDLPLVDVVRNLDGSRSVHLDQLEIHDDGQILSIELYLPQNVGILELKGEISETLEINYKSFSDIFLKGKKADLNTALAKIVIEVKTHYVGESSLKIKVSDSGNLSSTKAVTFTVNQSYTLPIVMPRNATLIGIEDLPLSLDDIVSWVGDSSSDSRILEMTLMTKPIRNSKTYRIDFAPSLDPGCQGNEINSDFVVSYGSQKTDQIKVTASESTIEASVLQLPGVSAAKIKKTMNASGAGYLEIKLLTLLDRDEVNEVKVTSFDVRNDPASICQAEISISNKVDVESNKDFLGVWNIPDVKSFNFHISKSADLGGIHFPYRDYRENPSESVVMRGTLVSLKKALRGFHLHPPPNFFGRAIIVIRISVVGDSLQRQDQDFPVNFESIDDPTQILWKGSVVSNHSEVVSTLDENGSVELSDFSIRDIDCDNQNFSLKMRVKSGRLCCRDEALLLNHLQSPVEVARVLEKSGQQLYCSDGIVAFTEKFVTINELVQSFVYKPIPGWWGVDEFIVNVTSEREDEINASILFLVKPVEDKPGIKLPETLMSPVHIKEDSSYEFRGIRVFDHDVDNSIPASVERCAVNTVRCYLSVDLIVNHGALELVETTLLAISKFHNKISLRGTIDELNTVLKSIIYQPQNDYFGGDALVIFVMDDSNNSSTETVHLFIDPLNDAPYFYLPKVRHMVEDVESVIGGESEYCNGDDFQPPFISCLPIQIYDTDVTNTVDINHNGTMRVLIHSTNLQVKIPRLGFSNSTVVLSDNIPRNSYRKSIQFYGPLEEINWILCGITLRGDTHFNTKRRSPAILHIDVEDAYGARTVDSMELLVDAVNDKPKVMIQLPLMMGLVVEEDTTTQVLGISVQDVDCNDDEFLELQLSSTFGSIYVLGKTDSFSQSLVTRSTMKEINKVSNNGFIPFTLYVSCFHTKASHLSASFQFLEGNLLYRPSLNFFGNDAIEVTISDLGNHGSVIGEKEILFAKASIPVTIKPKPDIPIIRAPEFIQMKEDSLSRFEVSIEHFDSPSTDLTISMNCTHGKIQMYSSANLSLSLSTDTMISGRGSVEAWNIALSQLLYYPEHNSNTADDKPLDQIYVKARNTGDETTQVDTRIVYIQIEGLPDPPKWVLPDTINNVNVLEDDDIALNLYLQDDDGGNTDGKRSLYFVRITASSGLIQLYSYQGIFFKDGDAPSKSTKLLEFYSTLDSINHAIQRIVYTPMPNFYGHDELQLFVAESDSTYNSTVRIDINVLATYDAPRVVTPMIMDCEEEEICSVLPSLYITDPDENSKLQVQISSEVGKLSFGDFNPELFSVNMLHEKTFPGTSNITLSGSAFNLNLVLARLVYLSPSGNHVDLLLFTIHPVNEQNSTTSEMYVIVSQNISSKRRHLIRYDKVVYHDDENCPSSYHEINSTGYDICHGLPQVDQTVHCLEDLRCPILGFTIKGDALSSVTVKIKVEYGRVDLDGVVKDIYESVSISGPSEEIELRGITNAINEALKHLAYIPAPNYVGDDKLQMDLHGGVNNEFQHSHEVEINVESTFDTLHIIYPAHHIHFVAEDEYLSIKGIELRHVSKDELVYVQVDLNATYGTIKLTNGIDPKAIAVTNEGHGSWWSYASLCGRFHNMKPLLTNISFRANENWNSVENQGDYAELFVEVRRTLDCESSAMGDAEDSITIPIVVNPVNDPPQIKVGLYPRDNENLFLNTDQGNSTLRIDEDHNLKIPISITDVDDDIIKVIAKVIGQGKVSVLDSIVGYNSDALFMKGDGSGRFHEIIAIKGRIDAINRYLQNLTFKGKGNKCTISIEAIDYAGDSQSVEVPIQILELEDDVVLWMVVDASITQPLFIFEEGESRLLGGDWLRNDVYMEARDIDGDKHQKRIVRPLSGQSIFSFSLSDPVMLTSLYICTEYSVGIGLLSIENESNLSFVSKRVGTHLRFRGTIDEVNRAGEQIVYHAQPGATGNSYIEIKASKEVCEGAQTLTTSEIYNSGPICRCDFEISPEVYGKVDMIIR